MANSKEGEYCARTRTPREERGLAAEPHQGQQKLCALALENMGAGREERGAQSAARSCGECVLHDLNPV